MWFRVAAQVLIYAGMKFVDLVLGRLQKDKNCPKDDVGGAQK